MCPTSYLRMTRFPCHARGPCDSCAAAGRAAAIAATSRIGLPKISTKVLAICGAGCPGRRRMALLSRRPKHNMSNSRRPRERHSATGPYTAQGYGTRKTWGTPCVSHNCSAAADKPTTSAAPPSLCTTVACLAARGKAPQNAPGDLVNMSTRPGSSGAGSTQRKPPSTGKSRKASVLLFPCPLHSASCMAMAAVDETESRSSGLRHRGIASTPKT